MNEGIFSIGDIVLKVNKNIVNNDLDMSNAWRDTVLKIKSFSEQNQSEYDSERMSLGERLAAHTRIVDYKRGIVLVESDHSGWIQYLKFYQKFILTGLRRKFPDIKINNLAFRLAGTSVKLSDVYEADLEKATKKMAEKSERDSKKIEQILNADKKQEKESEEDIISKLPPEILENFKAIKCKFVD